jgi:two-component system sensor histidine kinase QseC
MNVSIRKFLLINLLLAVTVTTTLTVVGNYYIDQGDIQYHLDTLLAQTSLSLRALLSQNMTEKDLTSIQSALEEVPNRAEGFFNQETNHHPLFRQFSYQDKFQFQVWKDNQLLIHSASSPNTLLSDGKPGFTTRRIGDKQWRVFTQVDEKYHYLIEVAERFDIRNQLVYRIAVDDLYIMFWTYPLSGLLIWIIIGKGLSGLKGVTSELKYRASNNLEPIEVENVPQEIKPLVEELNKLFLRLQQALDREKRFAADAAHELRTPLAALKTQAQIAINAKTPEEREILLRNLIACVDRSTHVVQQLLTLSRLVPEAHSIDDTIIMNLSKLTAEIVAQLVPSAIEKNIEIELNAEKDDIFVTANITAISILIRNLVDNAIRYTSESGAVKVDIFMRSGHTVFRVTDNGPGIPAELRTRVFERFFRVLGNKSPGSGLGLAIVQQIAKLHNAQVRLGAPETGHGLEVEVIFP